MIYLSENAYTLVFLIMFLLKLLQTVIEMAVKEMTGDCVQSLPSVATISRMAYEMGVLSDIQSGELLVTQDNITLAWDATCIDGSHINEVHICAPGGKANVLQINGGKTDDYCIPTLPIR